MGTCRLEMMSVPDAAAYRRMARGILPRAMRLISGLNVPNKRPGEPLLEWCRVLLQELPDVDVCVHYSVKHHRGEGEPATAFAQFCKEAEAVGVKRVLLCTGNGATPVNTLTVLERLRSRPASKHFRIGVCFNAGIPDEKQRDAERQRLRRKLETGWVDEVWLNASSDAELQSQGVAVIQDAAERLHLQDLKVFGSTLLPNDEQRRQMLERPWCSVHLSDVFLSSLTEMWRLTSEVLGVYREDEVEPVVESKVRTIEDVEKLQALLLGKEMPAGGKLRSQSTSKAPTICKWCRASDKALFYDSSDRGKYCSECWQAYYGKLPEAMQGA